MSEEVQRYFNKTVQGGYCTNCEKGFADNDIVFMPSDATDNEVIRNKIFCNIRCAKMYENKLK